MKCILFLSCFLSFIIHYFGQPPIISYISVLCNHSLYFQSSTINLHATKGSSYLRAGYQAPTTSRKEKVLAIGQVTRAVVFDRDCGSAQPLLNHGLEGNGGTNTDFTFLFLFSLLPLSFIGQTKTGSQGDRLMQSTKVSLPGHKAGWKRDRVDLERQRLYQFILLKHNPDHIIPLMKIALCMFWGRSRSFPLPSKLKSDTLLLSLIFICKKNYVLN